MENVINVFWEAFDKACSDFKNMRGSTWRVSLETYKQLWGCQPVQGLELEFNGGIHVMMFGVPVKGSRYHEGPPMLIEEGDFLEEPDFTELLKANNQRYGESLHTYRMTQIKFRELIGEYKNHYRRLSNRNVDDFQWGEKIVI